MMINYMRGNLPIILMSLKHNIEAVIENQLAINVFLKIEFFTFSYV